MAVDAPHAAHPERFSYQQLAERIERAATAFRQLGLKSGDVVGLFAENSPRWLVADQGLMRAGGVDAVRGATAPVEELRYILEDSTAVALVVQTGDCWSVCSCQQIGRLVCALSWCWRGRHPLGRWIDAFLSRADGYQPPTPWRGESHPRPLTLSPRSSTPAYNRSA